MRLPDLRRLTWANLLLPVEKQRLGAGRPSRAIGGLRVRHCSSRSLGDTGGVRRRGEFRSYDGRVLHGEPTLAPFTRKANRVRGPKS